VLYKLANDVLTIKDTVTKSEYQVDVGALENISFLSVDRTRTNIALSGCGESNKPELYTCKLGTGKLREVYSGKADDLTWLANEDRLLFNSGNTIWQISSTGDNLQRLFKFSTISFSPILLSLNPGGTKLAFTKWDGRLRNICTYDLLEDKEVISSVVCSYYSWLDNRRIIYSQSGAINILDVNSLKTTTFIQDARVLRRKTGFVNTCHEIAKLLSRSNPVQVKAVGEPKYFQNRIYLKVYINSNNCEKAAILSTTSNMANWRQHFITGQGYIKGYSFLERGETLAVYLEYPLQKGTSPDELLYYHQNQLLDFEGYYPFPDPSFPTIIFPLKISV